MSQLYARVFTQILDSSIAEDFTTRHVFEDFFKLCTREGIVDMTRHAISRRLNVPLDTLNKSISKLESPDSESRDAEFQGKRIERLDEHRDWGWRILNWPKYEAMRTRADVAARVSRFRSSPPPEGFTKPTIDELKLQCAKAGLPAGEAERFFHYYESNGWRVGKNPMRSWQSALVNWRKNYQGGQSNGRPTPLWRQRQLIEEKIATHPANPEFRGHLRERVTPEMRVELKDLRQKLHAISEAEVREATS